MRPIARRRRVPGTRANRACANCKERKLKCDERSPTCTHCHRLQLTCLVEDPDTKRLRPRNYLETLEQRLALLEPQASRSPALEQSPKPATALTTSSSAGDGNTSSSLPAFASSSDDEATLTSDLSSRVGFLDVKATQVEPQYLGSSSAFAFSHLISPSLRRIIPHRPSLEKGTSDQVESAPAPCFLPDPQTTTRLSNAYFENIHIQYPFLHEPTFRRCEEQLWIPDPEFNDPNAWSIPLFFINMVYATGALLLPGYQHMAEQLYSSAQLHLEVLSLDNLEAIQGILCYAMYSLRSTHGPSLWKLSGLALRQCIELGYHRSMKQRRHTGNVLQEELKKRVFWCAQGIDCAYAMRLGRPLGIQLNEVDVELPMDIDDALVSSTGILGSPRSTSEQRPTTMSTPIHVMRLRCIWSRIHSSLYSIVDTTRPLDRPHRRTLVDQFRAELEEWLATAPETMPQRNNALSIFCTKDWYDSNYCGTLLVLYRSQLAEGNNTPESIFIDCMQAASTVCRVYRRQYVGTLVKATWSTLHCLFLAGLTYLHCLWASHAALQAAQYNEVSKTCTDCTMVLVVIAEAWSAAAPYRDIFELLASHTLSMMVNKKCQPQAEPQVSTLADSSEREAVSKWRADIDDMGMFNSFDDLLSMYVDGFGSFQALEADV